MSSSSPLQPTRHFLGPWAAKSTIYGQPDATATADPIHRAIVSVIQYGFTTGTLCEII